MSFLFVLLLSLSGHAENSILPTVENLDLEKYQGLWHEVAAMPQRFQQDCFKNTTAEYSLISKRRVKVINSCEAEDGSMIVAEGRARKNLKYRQASKLKVTFAKSFGFWLWFAAGDYWVFDLEPEYQWSVVGSPDFESLWILARTKTLDIAQLTDIASTIDGLGFDSCKVLMSRSDDLDLEERVPLCEYIMKEAN